MSTDQLGGITYTYANINAFLANTPTQVQYFGDLSEPSPFSNGASGDKHIEQEYYVGLRAGRMARAAQPDAELRPALRLLRAAPRARQPDRQVQHRQRRARPAGHAVLPVEEEQLPAAGVGDLLAVDARRSCAAASASSSARARRRIRFSRSRPSASARPCRAARSTRSRSIRPWSGRTSSTTRTTASYQPRAYANEYTLPEKVYQYTASIQQELRREHGGDGRVCRQPGPQPLPAQRREPDHRRAVERRGRRAPSSASSTS